jgi:hypothetical protein
VVLFEVTTGIGGEAYKQGDYILAANMSSCDVASGAMVFETGRNGKAYRYLEDNGMRVLVGKDEKELMYIKNDEDLDGFYVIIWVFQKP